MNMLACMSVESPVHGNMHAGFGGAGRGNGLTDKAAPRPGSTLFEPCSYGFRPQRRAHDAIAEIHYYTSRSYEWIVDADIADCFDQISHPILQERIRKRVGDKRVLALIKAFLKAGILTEDGIERDTNTGAPQGAILSPLLSNIALSVLDDYFMQAWEAMGGRDGRARRRRNGEATYRLVRYADDWLLMVAGTQAHAVALCDEAAAVLAPMGLSLSETKTRIVHIDEGSSFLGFRIRRDTKRGTNKRYIYTYPSKEALASIKRKVRVITNQGTNQPLENLLRQLNPALQGWTSYFQHGVSKQTFAYLSHFVWWRVVKWLRRKHARTNWKQLRALYGNGKGHSWPVDGDLVLYDPARVAVTRYRYRGNIPTPWQTDP